MAATSSSHPLSSSSSSSSTAPSDFSKLSFNNATPYIPHPSIRVIYPRRPEAFRSTIDSPQTRHKGDTKYVHTGTLNRSVPNRPNAIRTAKYTKWGCIPMVVLNQFRKVANIFFLAVVILSFWPFSPLKPGSVLMTFCFVFTLPVAKEVYEDYRRHVQDRKANEYEAWRFDFATQTWVVAHWQALQVGDLVVVPRDESFPCDLVLVASANANGEALVDTCSLDGESNLKSRKSLDPLHEFIQEAIATRPHSPLMSMASLVKTYPKKMLTVKSRMPTAKLEPLETGFEIKTFPRDLETPEICYLLNNSHFCLNVPPPNPDASAFSGTATFFINEVLNGELVADGGGGTAGGFGPKVTIDDAGHWATRDCNIGLRNSLYRGCVLRDTAWALGIAVFTGDETKIRLNARSHPTKTSSLQRMSNRLILYLLIGLATISLFFSVASFVVSQRQASGLWYLSSIAVDAAQKTFWSMVPINFLVFLLGLSFVIPMSLYVALEALKISLTLGINYDPVMTINGVDWLGRSTRHLQPNSMRTVARTSDLTEDLGQVKFLFSDKTGTLTRNEMEFVRCSVGGRVLGPSRDMAETNRIADRANAGIVGDVRPLSMMSSPLGPQISDFFRILSICHSVRPTDPTALAKSFLLPEAKNSKVWWKCGKNASAPPQRRMDTAAFLGHSDSNVDEDDSFSFIGSSPDEIALAVGAARMGHVLLARDEDTLVVKRVGTGDIYFERWKVLAEFAFTSERKRSSMLVRNDDGEHYVFSKGADSVMLPLLTSQPDLETIGHLGQFAAEGLRTLVIAQRKLTREWVSEFLLSWSVADGSGDCSQLYELTKSVESELVLVGVTAVEDRLQEGVPECLKTLQEGGIRVVVLTGDKLETAVEIGKACQLFPPDTEILQISNLVDIDELKSQLNLALDADHFGGVAIDGISLQPILDNSPASKLFVKVLSTFPGVLCCRLDPKQKRDVVRLVKRRLRVVTAAVGDGANDVPMILEASVGIGIHGLEGSQAVMASDFALPAFRFLAPLFLIHGRRAYRRMSVYIQYFLYKNVVICAASILWNFYDGWSGQILFPEWFLLLYNSFWTSYEGYFQVFGDVDVPRHVAIARPAIYKLGHDSTFLRPATFFGWMLAGVWHGFGSFALAFLCIADIADVSGVTMGFWFRSSLLFSVAVQTVFIRLGIHTISWNLLTLGAYIFSYVAYWGTAVLLSVPTIASVAQPEILGILYQVLASPMSCVVVLTMSAVLACGDLAAEVIRFRFFPNSLDLEMHKYRARFLHPKDREGDTRSDEELIQNVKWFPELVYQANARYGISSLPV